MGPSCRAVLASCAAGLPGLVAQTRADPHASDYHLHGFARLSAEHLEFMVMAALVAYVPDALIVELMEDDRLVRRAEELQQAVRDEVSWLLAVPGSVWCMLASLVGSSASGPALRHRVVTAAFTAW
eukprot:5350049-Lingulodinium_polyedra.AAC.1